MRPRAVLQLGAIIGVLAAILVGLPAASQTEPVCISDLNASGPGDAGDGRGLLQDPGSSMPVVFVHGWRGNAYGWDTAIAGFEATLGDRITTYAFDYSHPSDGAFPVNELWVTHADIAPRLRNWIMCLADVSLDNGGPGRVALVAHSMGGLAIRETLGNEPAMGDRVAVVATMGTPHLGSVFGGDQLDFVDAVQAIVNPIALLEDTAELILVDNPAQDALGRGSEELAALPDYPNNVPVWSAAGEITITRQFFNWSDTTAIGDIVVDQPSATDLSVTLDGLGGTYTDVCDALVPYVALPIWPWVLSVQMDRLAQCFHLGLPASPNMIKPAIAQVVASMTRTGFLTEWRAIESETATYSLMVVYPQFAEHADTAIEEIAASAVEDAVASFAIASEKYEARSCTPEGSRLRLAYEATFASPDLVSVVGSGFSQFCEGTGNGYNDVFLLDADGSVLDPDSQFTDAGRVALWEIISATLDREIGGNFGLPGEPKLRIGVVTDGLTVHFAHGEVAVRAMGAPTLLIPWDEVSDLLTRESPLAAIASGVSVDRGSGRIGSCEQDDLSRLGLEAGATNDLGSVDTRFGVTSACSAGYGVVTWYAEGVGIVCTALDGSADLWSVIAHTGSIAEAADAIYAAGAPRELSLALALSG